MKQRAKNILYFWIPVFLFIFGILFLAEMGWCAEFNWKQLKEDMKVWEQDSWMSLCWATDYYVDATAGSDNNDGESTGAPWQTITKVNAQSFIAGDNIYFKKGELWEEELKIPTSGTSGNQITYGSYSTGSKPIISGADNVTTSGWADQGSNVWRHAIGATEPDCLWFNGTVIGTVDATPDADYEWTYSNPNLDVYAEDDPDNGVYYTSIHAGQRDRCINLGDGGPHHYITIDGLTLKYNNGGSDRAAIDFYSSTEDTLSDIIIKNCTISYTDDSGIRLVLAHAGSTLDGLKIYSNTIEYIGSGTTGYGIKIGSSNANCYTNLEIYQNDINNCKEEGIRLEKDTNGEIYKNMFNHNGYNAGGGSANLLIGDDCDGSKIYENWFEDGSYEGIWLGDANIINIKIYYNIFVNSGTTSDVGYTVDFNEGVTNSYMYNNVLYNSYAGIRVGGNAQVTGIVLKNNIIRLNENSENFNEANSSTFTSDNNCWDETDNFYTGGASKTWAQWQGLGHDANGYYQDPIFLDTDNDDFSLRPGSPCINAGTNLGDSYKYALDPGDDTFPYDSYDQNLYPPWEIGAFTYIRSYSIGLYIDVIPQTLRRSYESEIINLVYSNEPCLLYELYGGAEDTQVFLESRDIR